LVVRLLLLLWLIGTDALAHGVADDDKTFIEQSTGMQLIPYIYLGDKHMVSGYVVSVWRRCHRQVDCLKQPAWRSRSRL